MGLLQPNDHGKTILVTGINSGIGQESARVLALRGARILGAARTRSKAREACAALEGDPVPLPGSGEQPFCRYWVNLGESVELRRAHLWGRTAPRAGLGAA